MSRSHVLHRMLRLLLLLFLSNLLLVLQGRLLVHEIGNAVHETTRAKDLWSLCELLLLLLVSGIVGLLLHGSFQVLDTENLRSTGSGRRRPWNRVRIGHLIVMRWLVMWWRRWLILLRWAPFSSLHKVQHTLRYLAILLRIVVRGTLLLVIRLEPLLEARGTSATALVIVLIAIVTATRSTKFTSRILKVIALNRGKGRILC